MKKYFALFALIVFIPRCSSFDQKTKTPPIHEDVASTTNLEIGQETTIMEMTIEGMVCAMGCAAVIEKKLNKTAGITNAKVDFNSKKAHVKFNREILSSTDIIEIVKKVGEAYSVSEFSITQ